MRIRAAAHERNAHEDSQYLHHHNFFNGCRMAAAKVVSVLLYIYTSLLMKMVSESYIVTCDGAFVSSHRSCIAGICCCLVG
jgi:hypothetical protein